MSLMCHAWNSGTLPSEEGKLARLCGASEEEFREVWPAIKPCFDIEDGRLVHPGLEELRQEALRTKRKLSAAGTKGANARWGDRSDGVAKAEPSSGHRPPYSNIDTDAEAEPEPEAHKEFLSGSSRRAEENANLAGSRDDLPWK